MMKGMIYVNVRGVLIRKKENIFVISIPYVIFIPLEIVAIILI